MDRERLSVQPFRESPSAFRLVDTRQAGEVDADLVAAWSERPAEGLEGSLIKTRRLGESSPSLDDRREGGDVRGDQVMPRAQRPRPQDHGAPCRCLGAPVTAPAHARCRRGCGRCSPRPRSLRARRHGGSAGRVDRTAAPPNNAPGTCAAYRRRCQRAGQIQIALAKPPLRSRDGAPPVSVGEGIAPDDAVHATEGPVRLDPQATDVASRRRA